MPVEQGIQKLDPSKRCPLTTGELKRFDPPKTFFQHWQMAYCTTPSSSLADLLLLPDSGCEWLTANACHLRGPHSLSSVIRSTCQSNPPLKYPIVNLATHNLEVANAWHMLAAPSFLYHCLTMNAAFKSVYVYIVCFKDVYFIVNNDLTYCRIYFLHRKICMCDGSF